jgi:coenzyme F420-0:L-glutamate ligase/coenzyme F420-1:gamma-L-glutamate ligase
VTNRRLELIAVSGIPQVTAGDHLGNIIAESIASANLTLIDGDVLVVAQKIVSKAEGRTVRLGDIKASDAAIELAKITDKEPAIVQLILDESSAIVRHRPGVIIAKHKQGWILANAGIDRSNVTEREDEVLLLPEQPDASASQLRDELAERYAVTIGVIIADSVGRPWRMGTTGMTLGSAGVEALANLRGQQDMFGRILEVSEHAVADSIASAAELLLGEANEATPVVIVRGLNEGHSAQNSTVLLRPTEEDMFR